MSNNNGGKGNVIFGVIIALIILGLIGSCSGDHVSENKRRCDSCGRTFTNSDDTHSIAWTGMCENCYDNYKFAQEVREEILKYNERYGD